MGGKVLEYEAKTIWRQGYEEGREESIQIIVSALNELDIPTQAILESLQKHFNLSLEDAKKYIETAEPQRSGYQAGIFPA